MVGIFEKFFCNNGEKKNELKVLENQEVKLELLDFDLNGHCSWRIL